MSTPSDRDVLGTAMWLFCLPIIWGVPTYLRIKRTVLDILNRGKRGT